MLLNELINKIDLDNNNIQLIKFREENSYEEIINCEDDMEIIEFELNKNKYCEVKEIETTIIDKNNMFIPIIRIEVI